MSSRIVFTRFVVLVFLFSCLINFTIGQGRVDWAKSYGNSKNNFAYSFSKINADSYLIAGTSWKSSSEHFDYSVYAINDTGHVLWSTIFGTNDNDIFYDALAVGDGIILSGYSGENAGHLSVIKLSTSGDILWQYEYASVYNSTSKIFELSNGKILIAVTNNKYTTDGGYGQGDISLLKLNADGTLIFQKNYGGSRFDKLLGGILTSNEDLLLVGQTWSDDGIFVENNGLSDGFILKINAAGDLLWENTYGNELEDELADIIETDNGDFVALGTIGQLKDTTYIGDLDNLLIRINSSGDVIWEKAIGTDIDERGKAITLLNDSFVFTGTKSTHNQDITIYKMDNDGTVVFDTLFSGEETDIPSDILEDDDAIFMTGFSRSDITDFFSNHGQYDMWAVKINGLLDVELPLPECTTLTHPHNGTTNVGIHEQLTWDASAYASGYRLTIGTSPGGSDILDNVDLGNVLSYNPGTLLCQTHYYVSLIPYNSAGEPIGCTEHNFTTVGITAVIGDNIAFCQGESGEISASGGEQYSWTPFLGLNDPTSSSPTVSPNETMTYTVVVTGANGCTATGEVVVTVNPTPLPNAAATAETGFNAHDGTAIATPITGAPPFEYIWSNDENTAIISDLTPDDYTVTVTDANGCSASQTVTVLSFDCNSLEVWTDVSNISCHNANDGYIHLTPNGNEPFTFDWSHDAHTAHVDNLSATTYSVTVTDANSCHKTLEFTLSEPDELVATASIQQPTSTENIGSIAITPYGGTSPYDILWSSGASDFVISDLGAGNYYYTLSDSNNCTYKDTIDLSIVSIGDMAIVDNLMIFPNPNTGFFEITWQLKDIAGTGSFVLRNQLGQIVWQKQVEMVSLYQSVDIVNKVSGIYTLEITTKSGKITKKVVIH